MKISFNTVTSLRADTIFILKLKRGIISQNEGDVKIRVVCTLSDDTFVC